MCRLLLSGLAGMAVLVAAMDPADARDGSRDGGRHFSRGGGHGSGWGHGGPGIGVGAGLVYHGGWGSYHPG